MLGPPFWVQGNCTFLPTPCKARGGVWALPRRLRRPGVGEGGRAKGILQQLAHFQKLNAIDSLIGITICFVDNDLKSCIFFLGFLCGLPFSLPMTSIGILNQLYEDSPEITYVSLDKNP